MIIDYLVDNFELFIKIVAGAFLALVLSAGIFMVFVICYVLIEDWKRSKKK